MEQASVTLMEIILGFSGRNFKLDCLNTVCTDIYIINWHNSISVPHWDAGDAVASPKLKNWPLFGQTFSTFGQSIQLHSRVSEVVSIFPTKAK